MKPYECHPIMKKAMDDLNVHIPNRCIGIHGKLYDVQHFQKNHPGGIEWILTCKGTDATALFENMHLNSKLAKFQLEKIPCIGTYTPRLTWDFEGYRQIKSDMLTIFPTRSSRKHTSFRFQCWCILAFSAHLYLLSCQTIDKVWYISLIFSAICNSIIGGFGHNYIHFLDKKSMALDWNGLSSFEWILEHVISHHCHTNLKHDHDSISMLPFVNWNKKTWTNLLIFPLFFIGELVVALQGYLGHRCRWYPFLRKAYSLWIRFSPFVFLIRITSHFLFQSPIVGLSSILLTLMIASFYFSYLAHLNHAFEASQTYNFLDHQLGSTGDLKSLPILNDLLLGLDRQTLHHLFPTIDHSLLDIHTRNRLQYKTKNSAFVQHSFMHMNYVMFKRLFP